jgi:hypothetical protein
MKIALALVLFLHGLIHLLGFVKAFALAPVPQLQGHISRPAGIFWLLAALLLVGSGVLLTFGLEFWWVPAAAGVVLSQILIFTSWRDARFGTLANLILLLPVLSGLLGALPSSYRNQFRADAESRLLTVPVASVLTERDIQHLPSPVQDYLRFTGSVGRPKVLNFRAVMTGAMRRTLDGEWQEIVARQYSFYGDMARLFYIESSMYGIPFDGYHAYQGDAAVMLIKVGGLLQVVDARGEEMNRGETVTMLNDMCLLAPATLISPAIRWEPLDSLSVKATFTNQGNTISATLTFDPSGALKDFVSNDRFLSEDGKIYLRYPWSTPVGEFREFDGRKLASYAEALWHTPSGEFVYGKFTVREMEYNCTRFR